MAAHCSSVQDGSIRNEPRVLFLKRARDASSEVIQQEVIQQKDGSLRTESGPTTERFAGIRVVFAASAPR